MMAVGAVLALASIMGTGLKIYGGLRQANEFKRVSFQNAQLARYAANDAVSRGQYEVYKRRLESARMQGAQAVAIAEGGASVAGGSAELVQFDTALAADLDSLILSNNAAREAWGYEREATEMERAGRRAKKEAVLGAIGVGVSGAAGAYSTYKGGQ
jgi:hypothetical protein